MKLERLPLSRADSQFLGELGCSDSDWPRPTGVEAFRSPGVPDALAYVRCSPREGLVRAYGLVFACERRKAKWSCASGAQGIALKRLQSWQDVTLSNDVAPQQALEILEAMRILARESELPLKPGEISFVHRVDPQLQHDQLLYGRAEFAVESGGFGVSLERAPGPSGFRIVTSYLIDK